MSQTFKKGIAIHNTVDKSEASHSLVGAIDTLRVGLTPEYKLNSGFSDTITHTFSCIGGNVL